jgi:putative ABC transport system permease protein
MLHDLMFRLRALFRSRTREHDLDDELQFHLHNEIAKYVRGGMTPEQAARRARIEFGGLEQIKEQTRESHGVELMESAVRDLWYGARVLRKNPSFTAVAVLSLALGIGANAAIFQLINAIRLRALPVQAPQELADIRITDMSGARGSQSRDNAVTYRIWEQLRERQTGFAGIAAWSDDQLNLSPSGEVRQVRGLWVSGEFFSLLGVQPTLGRLFAPSDDYRGCGAPGAVISYNFWRSELAGDSSVIGRKITVNGHPVAILGVTPASFFGVDAGRAFQIALPVCSVTVVRGYDALNAGTLWWLSVIGRVKPGWTAPRAAAQLEAISPAIFQSSLPSNYPPESIKNYLTMKLTALPAPGGVSNLGERYSDPLWMLLAIAGLVLLIACFNLANLLLARASAREREISLRLAIGASRGRLIRQLMAESLLIAGAGAALGLGLSYSLSRVIVSLLDSRNDSVFLDLHTDWRVLAFGAALAIATCLIFGLAPALRATRGTLNDVFKGSGRGMTSSRERLGLRRALVVSQIALSLVLLVGSLLFLGSLRKLLKVETGFHKEGVLIADLRFAREHPASVQLSTYQKRLLDQIGAIPGVTSVAATTVVPISGNSWGNHVWMEDKKRTDPGESYFSHISPRYFRAFGTALLAGRDFSDRDTASAPKVAIVNSEFARRLAKSDNPVGRRFFVEATPSTPETEYEIIGVVANTKYRRLREPFQPVAFLAMAQDPAPSLQDQIIIRTSAPSATLFPEVRRAIAEVDPGARFALINFNEMMYDSLSRERLMAILSTGFGVLAGLLSACGLYGMISYMVAQRRSEIGVRMALGADRRTIHAMVLGDSGRLVAAGLAIGIPLSIAAASLVRTLLYGLKPYDAVILLIAAALLTLVALIATWVPARRAAMLDPMPALREE